ncbi:hypothetical protein MAHJHV65_45230 [Mycobacterium avium subsp. hominissuis]|uniref:hypothetical protein n=1 Tax=Mycobacterium avium TaxID=1764 RepID=UPI0007A04AA7|nr:hypothetical protein [Mycobacterium avium]MBZ4508382.1 hypothetical protein [Mycobacterium avium subsp. hominissuis]MCA2295890.1 hypothetical protein [Mycobacterium avium]
MSAKKSHKPSRDDGDQKPDRAAVRAAHLTKFNWSRDVSADPHLSQAAKHLAARMAVDKFGTNGTARATQKELAKICGTTIRTIRRATTELGDGSYWDVAQLGGANRYTLIPPDDRVERWNAARRQWESICRKWDKWKSDCCRWLEKEAQHLWLDAETRAETEFTMPIFEAVSRRARENNVTDPYGFARHLAEQWWDWKVRLECPGAPKIVERIRAATDEQIVELATRRGYHTPPPRCTECAAELPADRAELAVCIDCAWTEAEVLQADNIDTLGGQDRHPRRTESVPQADKAEALSCENGDSTSTSSTPKYEEARPLPATGAPSGAALDNPSSQPVAGGQAMDRKQAIAACGLCDVSGVFLDADGDWVSMAGAGGMFWFVKCRHSMEGALAEIRRGESEGYKLQIKTGWPAIDSHYDDLIDLRDYDYGEGEILAEMTGTAPQFTDQRIGQ